MSTLIRGVKRSKISLYKFSDNDEQLLKELRDQKDTRISDRIRKRSSHQLPCNVCDALTKNYENSNNDACHAQSNHMFSSIQQNIYACSCSRRSPVLQSPSPCHEARNKCLPPPKRPPVSNINNLKFFDTTDDESFNKMKKINVHKTASKASIASYTPKKRAPIREIPTRPKVTLKSVKNPVKTTMTSTSQTRLGQKTSGSRFLASHVERIQEESLIFSPEAQNNDEFLEKMRQRDREAMIRGQKALEKERLQREYNEMMKNLPVLQKLERLNEMNDDKPEYHMTEERLREKERKKQTILENTYEEMFPDRRPVTIPVKNTSRQEKGKVSEPNSPTLNLGSWNAEKRSQKMYTEEEVEALLKEGKGLCESKFRTEQLKAVLEKLRKQKEEILKEIHNEDLADILPEGYSSSVADKKQNNEKKFVSVKVGTDSLVSSSSNDTLEETVVKPKTKQTQKVKSKSVQVALTDKKTKDKVTKTVVKESRETKTTKESVKTTKDTIKPNKDKVDAVPAKLKGKVEVEKVKSRGERDTSGLPSAPTNSLVSLKNEPTKKDKSNQFKSCECDENLGKKDLCEIVIKIKDGKSSEVKVKDQATKEKSVENVKQKEKVKESTLSRRLDEVNKALNDDCCRPDSWHTKFSKNNSQVSTSSTSYMSPPQVQNKADLKKKQQQTKSNNKVDQKDNRNPLLGEVQKLLAMSRQSVDELGVSTISSVTTPSQSIIEMESNKMADFVTPKNQILRSSPNFSFVTVSSENKTVVAADVDGAAYPDILEKYAKIADQCSQRISDLTSMIEKVREDKNKMLQTSSLGINGDSMTKYMDLPTPDQSNIKEKQQKSGSSHSSSSSGDSRLLEINFSLAEKLKGMTPQEIENFERREGDKTDSIEDELIKRFRALRKPNPINIINNVLIQSPKSDDKKRKTSGNTQDFVPLLMDIPKMPALPVDNTSSKSKKPPPSKSFLAARKFTNFAAPHELSTIPEQDSQLRLESTLRDKSPRQKEVEEVVQPPKKSPPSEKKSNLKKDVKKKNTEKVKIKTTTNTSSTSKTSSSRTKESNTSDNSLGSSADEKTEMLRIEAMLRSIGMDWAISTLRKTHEALAMTSSSSSIEVRSPASILQSLSESDLKEFLAKQKFQKISSSTLRTDASPGSLNETHEFSDIYKSEFAYKQTSTPVNRSRELRKGSDKSSDLPSAIDSDRLPDDFFSLPEQSL